MSDLLHNHVWSYRPGWQDDDSLEYMLVDMPRGRCITSVSFTKEPLKRGTLRLWCRQEEPGVMLTGHDRRKVERPSYYRYEGNVTYWKWYADGEEFPFAKVDLVDMPSWLTELVEIAHARMDVAERGGKDLRGC